MSLPLRTSASLPKINKRHDRLPKLWLPKQLLQQSCVYYSRQQIQSRSLQRRLIFLKSSCICKQNRDSSLNTTFYHSTSQCCHYLNHSRHLRRCSAVKRSINHGWCEKSPKARMQRYRLRILTDLSSSSSHRSPISRTVPKQSRKGSYLP